MGSDATISEITKLDNSSDSTLIDSNTIPGSDQQSKLD